MQRRAPDARYLPLWEKRATLTGEKWSASVASSLGTVLFSSCVTSVTGSMFQILTLWSDPAVAKRPPCGCTSTEKMGLPLPASRKRFHSKRDNSICENSDIPAAENLVHSNDCVCHAPPCTAVISSNGDQNAHLALQYALLIC